MFFDSGNGGAGPNLPSGELRKILSLVCTKKGRITLWISLIAEVRRGIEYNSFSLSIQDSEKILETKVVASL